MTTGGHIEIQSGVSLFTRKGFCTVIVAGERVGQLDPQEVRTMALHWLAAAEAAESDAAVLAMLTDHLKLDDASAGGFVAGLRAYRAQPEETDGPGRST